MNSKEFKSFRKKLNKTQEEMSQIIGISKKAVQSYEQGWRNIPPHIERHILFIFSMINSSRNKQSQCWAIKKCPVKNRKNCPAWEFKSGEFCWLINGTICDGKPMKNWNEKMKVCRSCDVLNVSFQ
ncbi:helix-turn-helix domain-containing protein [Spirochaetota bacterium]